MFRSIFHRIYRTIPEPALMPSENIRWNNNNKIKNKNNIRSGNKTILQQTYNFINIITSYKVSVDYVEVAMESLSLLDTKSKSRH